MIVETSAKSRLMKPSSVMRSEILLTPVFRMSSASENDSFIVSGLSRPQRSFSLGITIRESTYFLSSAIPLSAWSIFCSLSKRKGFVTTATVRMSISFAIWATTGAAPVPVPPPIPAVINIMSASLRADAISSLFSSADLSPTSGLLPAPLPRVSFEPIWIFEVAFEFLSAAASVLTAMYSMSEIPESAMQLRAFPPPPPTPITFMFTSGSYASFSKTKPAIIILLSNDIAAITEL